YPGMETAEALRILIKEHPTYLLAVSCGCVFFGAVSYIGNAPNLMSASIAAELGVKMPSFFGYILKYSIPLLIPTFTIITLLFFLQ
ncbi:MAG: sodium:proton antiporter, partial [candidate division WOR-3 bacterium]